MIGVIDYGVGNLKNVTKAMEYLGYEADTSEDIEFLKTCDKLILPGVGSFKSAMDELKKRKMDKLIYDAIDAKKPFMGICLGMQLLFESSEEGGFCEGLGVVKGSVKRLPSGDDIKVPHVGWNKINLSTHNRLFHDIPSSYFYFVHSYYVDAADKTYVSATCEYGITFDAAYEKDNVFAVQFHPEKSSDIGLELLTNFGGMK